MNHYRKTVRLYRERKKEEGCPFCKPERLGRAIYQNEHLYIVPNLTQYDLWELHSVQDHLLIVPKRHVETLQELTPDERLAVMNVVADYEVEGYNAYSRGVGFVGRSVKHQHTHLIKVDNKRHKFALFAEKPYILIAR